jgi:hypothetical protein
MAWLFSRITGQESTTIVPKLALYILYFSIHENTIFNWPRLFQVSYLFSWEISKIIKKFYMSSYLIFTVTYSHIFNGLPLAKKVNCKFDPMQMWYPVLWKQKGAYHFYEVHNAFISSFKRLIHGPNTSRLSLEVASFLDRKGSFEAMENFSVIRLYYSHEKPSYLPYYVSNKIFIVEICKNINFGLTSLMRKGKNNSSHYHGKLGK